MVTIFRVITSLIDSSRTAGQEVRVCSPDQLPDSGMLPGFVGIVYSFLNCSGSHGVHVYFDTKWSRHSIPMKLTFKSGTI